MGGGSGRREGPKVDICHTMKLFRKMGMYHSRRDCSITIIAILVLNYFNSMYPNGVKT